MSRHDRVKEAIKKEASIIIHDKLKDSRLGFVTITDVELSDNLRYAKIFFSVLGKEEDCKKTKEALISSLGFIRKLIAERINLRYAPEISFKEDKSSEYSVRIEEVLNEINSRTNCNLAKPDNAIGAGVKELNGDKKSSRMRKKA